MKISIELLTREKYKQGPITIHYSHIRPSAQLTHTDVHMCTA